MFAQSTLIPYHTEAFIKTEVGCTVPYQLMASLQNVSFPRSWKTGTGFSQPQVYTVMGKNSFSAGTRTTITV